MNDLPAATVEKVAHNRRTAGDGGKKKEVASS